MRGTKEVHLLNDVHICNELAFIASASVVTDWLTDWMNE